MEKTDSIAILGYGIEGKSMLRYLIDHGFTQLTVCDQKESLDFPSHVQLCCGSDYLKNLRDFSVVYRTPGISPLKKELVEAEREGVVLSSLMQFFFDHCPCPIIGVTGTKGKGTTSTLIYKMLQSAGFETYLGGNIGEPPVNFLDRLNEKSIVVLELSSFQLQDLKKSPQISVVLNVTSDHMDYHRDKEEYLSAKEAIVKFQGEDDVAIFNDDYEYFQRYEKLTRAKKFYVSREKLVQNGAYIKRGGSLPGIYFVRDGKEEFICTLRQPQGDNSGCDIGLIGSHNLENVLPAATVGRILNVPISTVQKVLRSFTGLPHRLEFVKSVTGVRYYNDSFSTTPDTSIAAVESFEQPTILIAGGSEKHADYTTWGEKVYGLESVRFVILMGQTAQKMEDALIRAEQKFLKEGKRRANDFRVLHAISLEEALTMAKVNAKVGWVTVMSPAAASFDMFKNYKERGETFKKFVQSLS